MACADQRKISVRLNQRAGRRRRDVAAVGREARVRPPVRHGRVAVNVLAGVLRGVVERLPIVDTFLREPQPIIGVCLRADNEVTCGIIIAVEQHGTDLRRIVNRGEADLYPVVGVHLCEVRTNAAFDHSHVMHSPDS